MLLACWRALVARRCPKDPYQSLWPFQLDWLSLFFAWFGLCTSVRGGSRRSRYMRVSSMVLLSRSMMASERGDGGPRKQSWISVRVRVSGRVRSQPVRTINEAPPSKCTDRSSPATVLTIRRAALASMPGAVRHSGWMWRKSPAVVY
jgi:hypothetical protein